MKVKVGQWKDVIGYEGYYLISDKGQIHSRDRKVKMAHSSTRVLKGRVMPQRKTRRGYLRVELSQKGVTKKYLVHRLVAQHFLIQEEFKIWVNHKDGNKLNNDVTNLEWVTPQDNILHSYKNNLNKGNGKVVALYNKNGVLIEMFSSQVKASKYMGYSMSYINNCQRKNKYENEYYKWEILTPNSQGGFNLQWERD